MKGLSSLSFTALWLISSPMSGMAMDLDKMGMASGLAEVLSKAEGCGYQIDEAALEKYYESNGLATPEILSYISNSISVAKFGDQPSKSDCTLARTTARSIGVLSQ